MDELGWDEAEVKGSLEFGGTSDLDEIKAGNEVFSIWKNFLNKIIKFKFKLFTREIDRY